jgi:ATP-dependent DNA helicase RecG
MNLSTPIENLAYVGPVYQKRLKKLGIKTVRDLIFHFPHRYEDFSNLKKISQVKVGERACLQGKILKIENTKTWKKRMILTQAILKDDSGEIKIVWFNQPYLVNVLKEGDFVSLAGKVISDEYGLYLSSPAYERISENKTLIHTGRIVPVYPETEGLSSRWLRFILRPILTKLRREIPEVLPEKLIEKYKILPIKKAIWQIHFPDTLPLAKRAKERFAFEEIFIISLFVLREKLKIASKKAIPIPINLQIIKNFLKSLPFALTKAQKKSTWEILKDLEKERPMNRLLEGDVGSGKTIVAVISVLNTIKSGFQVALMAPTEILAQQHFQKIAKILEKEKVKIGLMTGKENKIFFKKKIEKLKREKILEKIKEGEIDFLIGTHALIQEGVKFKNLAFVIIDEQHRFGVEQRAKLIQNSEFEIQNLKIPHFLSMTATPIPRTLALTIYGDLDLSLIDEMPKGRKRVITKVISPKDRQKAYHFIRQEVKKGRQVFVICPRIEPENQKTEKQISSWAEVKAVKEEYEKLSKIIFPDLKIGILHGKMKTEEKERVMEDFKNKKIDILVSTSVVEVGIDIENATLMMIEGAERFGLAQLHQFRGRVGRGIHQSFCFLFTESPAKKTRERLKALISCQNGFGLAEKDLEIRGPGDFIGQRQWGIPDLAMDSFKDIFLVEKAKRAAKEILEEDPQLKNYPLLKEEVEKFRERIHLE